MVQLNRLLPRKAMYFILDELDSKLWVYEDVMKNTEPGTFSQSNRWLDGAVVYNSDVDLDSH